MSKYRPAGHRIACKPYYQIQLKKKATKIILKKKQNETEKINVLFAIEKP